MEIVVLKSKSKTDLKLVTSIAKKIGIEVRYLNDDDKEEIGLIYAIKAGRTGKFVDTGKFLEKLRK